MSAVDLRDMQGGILRGYAHPHALYVFLRIDHPEGGRAWLADLIGNVRNAEEWGSDGKPRDALNVAFSAAGLRALGLPDRIMDGFPHPFRQGMAARAEHVLGDRGPSHPDRWEPGLREPHALVTIHGADAGATGRVREELDAGLGGDVRVVGELAAALLPPTRPGEPPNREHFGFSDGFAQPDVRGAGAPLRRGNGVPRRFGRWRPLALGEFVLGHRDEDGRYAAAPPGLRMNGTFMVWRKLHQDVARFRDYLLEAADGDRARAEWLAAKVVGRWQDGSPLALCPEGPDPALAADPDRVNDFRYGDDPHGLRCPLGAHVRRANPRDALGWGAKPTYRHRLLRRGMPYGAPLPEGAPDDGADRGLAFVCFNADLERQFEVVQGAWCSDGVAFGLCGDQDPLLGSDDGTGKHTIQGSPPVFLARQPSFVTTRGGEYLFVPGVRALRALADGSAARRVEAA